MAEFEALFGRGADVSYRLAGESASLNGGRGLSAVVSDICDTVYADTPSLRNEVLNRRNLTSQGAKARRDLLEVMIEKRYAPRLDLTGFGPERAMYEAVLFAPRLHTEGPDGWSFRVPGPSSDLAPAWRAMESILTGARDGFFTLDHLFAGLRSAPIGLLDGPIPVLVMAWLIVHSDDIAIYQDGTYQPRLTIEVVERALKAPDRFTLKHVVVVGARRRFLEQLVIGLQPRPLTADARNATVLQVVSPLVSVARGLPEFTRKTTAFLSARASAVRDSLLDAREPDRLLFSTLPEACELRALSPRSQTNTVHVAAYCNRLAEALNELESAYPRLLEWVGNHISERTRAPRHEVRANLAHANLTSCGASTQPIVAGVSAYGL